MALGLSCADSYSYRKLTLLLFQLTAKYIRRHVEGARSSISMFCRVGKFWYNLCLGKTCDTFGVGRPSLLLRTLGEWILEVFRETLPAYTFAIADQRKIPASASLQSRQTVIKIIKRFRL